MATALQHNPQPMFFNNYKSSTQISMVLTHQDYFWSDNNLPRSGVVGFFARRLFPCCAKNLLRAASQEPPRTFYHRACPPSIPDCSDTMSFFSTSNGNGSDNLERRENGQ
eukprot:Gb_33151 [translate_table: standard]